MPNDVQVVADGVESHAEARRSTPAALMTLLGAAALAAVLVIIVVAPEGTETVRVTTAPELVVPDLVPEAVEEEDLGISTVVPGFDGAIVAVASGADEDSLTHLLWPVADGVVAREMRFGAQPEFAADGIHIAFVRQMGEDRGDVLFTGRFSSMGVVAPGVTSFAWHDEIGGRIGYTTEDDSGTALYVAPANRTPRLVTTDLSEGDQLVAWGEWGFAIQNRLDEVVVLDGEGRFRGVFGGTVLDSQPSGRLLVLDDGFNLVSVDGSAPAVGISPDLTGPVRYARFSPDGSRVAIAGERGVVVVSVTDEGSVSHFVVDAVGRMTWSRDSRFIVVPERSGGIRVLDVERDIQHGLLVESGVLAVGLIPLSSP